LAIVNIVIQALLLAFLVWYTIETWKIRKTSQKQVEISQKQIQASQDQVRVSQEQIETSQKPCLMLEAEDRIPGDIDLKKGGFEGAQYVPDQNGAVRLTNVGFGPAFNVEYNFLREDPQTSSKRPTGNLIQIIPQEFRKIPVAQGLIAIGKWRLTLNYESFSGRKYETVITLDNVELKNVVHRSLPNSQ
jgi:hypothetical protein